MRYAVTVAMLVLAFSASAQPSVKASVNTTRVTQNVPFLITIDAKGTSIGDPVLPGEVQGLQISSTPSGQMQNFSISGTTMSRSRQWTYTAVASKPGEVLLPAFAVEIDGQIYKTEPIRLAVAPSGAREHSGRSTPTPRRAQAREPQADGVPTWEDIVLIETTVDKKKVYQGEGIELTMSVWLLDWPGVMISYTGPRNVEWPSTEGFYAGVIERQNAYEKRGTLPYNVETFKRSVYPTRSGRLTVGSWNWQGRARAFTSNGFPESRDYDLTSDPITIEVEPLPTPPEGFSGAVGNYTINSSIQDTQVAQGSPVKLRLRISGKGNPDALGAPNLPELPWAHVGSPEVEVSALASQSTLLEKEFSYDLTPLTAGEHEFPPVAFTFFEPLTGTYKTAQSDALKVNVIAAADGNRLITTSEQDLQAREQIRILAQDIEPIAREAVQLRPSQTATAAQGMILGAPPLAYVCIALLMRRRRRFREDISFARDYHARNRARKRLKNSTGSKEPAAEIFLALGEYLSDKLNLSTAGMTSQDAKAILEDNKIPQDLQEGYVKVMRACERERYASQKLSPHEISALRSAALDKLDKVDGLLRRERNT